MHRIIAGYPLKRKRNRVAAEFAILLWFVFGVCSAGAVAPAGHQSLRVALNGVAAPPDAPTASTALPTTPQDVVARVVAEKSDWFEWVGTSDAPDVVVDIADHLDSETGASTWAMRVTSRLETTQEKNVPEHFPAIMAIEPFLRIELRRLYTIKNLAVLDRSDVPIRFSLVESNSKVLQEGSEVRFRFSSPVAGYISLVNVDAAGNMHVIFPIGDESNKVRANEELVIPPSDPSEATYKYTVGGDQFGREYVKVVFSTVPLQIKGEFTEPSAYVSRVKSDLEGYRNPLIRIATQSVSYTTEPKNVR